MQSAASPVVMGSLFQFTFFKTLVKAIICGIIVDRICPLYSVGNLAGESPSVAQAKSFLRSLFSAHISLWERKINSAALSPEFAMFQFYTQMIEAHPQSSATMNLV